MPASRAHGLAAKAEKWRLGGEFGCWLAEKTQTTIMVCQWLNDKGGLSLFYETISGRERVTVQLCLCYWEKIRLYATFDLISPLFRGDVKIPHSRMTTACWETLVTCL